MGKFYSFLFKRLNEDKRRQGNIKLEEEALKYFVKWLIFTFYVLVVRTKATN